MNRWFKVSYLGLIYLFLYVPIFALIVYSFNNASFSMVWHGFTTMWYKQALQDSNLWIAVWHSFYLALSATLTALVIGTLGAISFYRYNFFWKKLLQGTLFILLIVPDLVLAIAFLILFSLLGVSLGFWSLYIAHVTFCIPFVVVIIYSRIKTIDPNIFAAASDLGASELQIFLRVILPLLLPAIISAGLLSFVLSFDDIVISYFVSGSNFEILSVKIFSLARLGVIPEVNALCSMLFLMTLILVCLSQWVANWRKI